MLVSIIGGGLTGSLAALEYADRGHRVTIFESAAALMTRASRVNEGKLHLGYVYAADPSFRTAARLIDDALLFRPILERWMTSAEFESCLCDPFIYVVPPDSALHVEAITQHFRRVDAHVRARMDRLNATYLGQPAFDHTAIAGMTFAPSFLTQERAVWPEGISAAVTRSVAAHPRITVRFGARVHRVAAAAGGWQLEFSPGGEPADGPFDIVVNAAWAERRSIDRRSGYPAGGSWFTRYKFGVVLKGASRLLSDDVPRNVTATSGPYGDCVYYPRNDSLYCSWYPVGMCFATLEDTFEAPAFLDERSDEFMRRTWQGCASVVPSLGKLAGLPAPLPASLLGDFIIARGESDIDDPLSGLHRRNDHGPIQLDDGYWSVETGKYTSAPRCAVECVAQSLGEA